MDALEVLMCNLLDKANLLNTPLKVFQVHFILARNGHAGEHLVTRHTAFSRLLQSFPGFRSWKTVDRSFIFFPNSGKGLGENNILTKYHNTTFMFHPQFISVPSSSQPQHHIKSGGLPFLDCACCQPSEPQTSNKHTKELLFSNVRWNKFVPWHKSTEMSHAQYRSVRTIWLISFTARHQNEESCHTTRKDFPVLELLQHAGLYTVSMVCLISSCRKTKRMNWVVKLRTGSESKQTKLLSRRGHAAVSTEITKIIQRLEYSPVKTWWVCWACSVWRGEGSRKALEHVPVLKSKMGMHSLAEPVATA